MSKPRTKESYRGWRRNDCRKKKMLWSDYNGSPKSRYQPVTNFSRPYRPNGERECQRRLRQAARRVRLAEAAE